VVGFARRVLSPAMHVALSHSLVATRLKDSLMLKRSLWLGYGDQRKKVVVNMERLTGE